MTPVDTSKMYSEIITLLDHSMDDIEAYVPLRCCGHLLAIVLMGRALKEVNDVSIWKHASHALFKNKLCQHCALNMDKEGMDKVHLIQRWIKDGLIGTVGEGERIRNLFGPKLNPPVLNLGGKGLTMPPNDEAWEEAGEICLMNNELFELPDSPNCPQLRVLCRLKLENSSNLEVLDFEGTEIISLPMDVGKLSKLTCLKLSFYGEDKDERKNNRSTTIIPHNVIGKLLQLEELSIDVNLDDERWNGTVKNIIKEVCSLKELKVLKLYLPEIVLLNDFMWNEIPFLSLSRFSFIVGGVGSLCIGECKEIQTLVDGAEINKQEDNAGDVNEETVLGSLRASSKVEEDISSLMHELISISSGLCIAPKVEWMSFYGCPNLKTLSPMDVSSSNLKGIIGEVDWWNELTWNVQKENLDSIFVPVKGVTELMNQIAEIGDQLQH
ncbi:hypothetical protein CK203_095865 [Vitis vinifera]|uniref:Disease resistance R13L4/SHOC-2-like LRR domain-containing protein n=1 Tax=Vitis vinifera TaxID=29760 RepID=A0A438C8P3_VITVI|nr:hypothetical protein CK203_095865 [Vitis vinifera]